MKKFWICLAIVSAAMALSGCAATMDRICRHPLKIELAARAALEAAQKISDPVKRMAALEAANLLLEAVAKCPAGAPR